MPFNVGRSVNSVSKEVLKFVSGLEQIESVVLAASEAEALPSAVTGVEGKLGLRAGTILVEVDGDDQRRATQYEGTGDIIGILTDNIYFYDDSDASDQPAAAFKHTAVFDKAKIIDFDDYETELKDELYTCRFEEKVDN